jgi:hypothetical protein
MYNCKAWSLSFSLLNFVDEFQYLLCLMTEIFVAEFVSVYLHIGICEGKLKQHTQRRIQGRVARHAKKAGEPPGRRCSAPLFPASCVILKAGDSVDRVTAVDVGGRKKSIEQNTQR